MSKEIEDYEKLINFIETKLLAGLLREPPTKNEEVIGIMRRCGEVLQEIHSFKRRSENE